MTFENDALDRAELGGAPGEEELHWQLVEQFYERSVQRYGRNSEQARLLSQLRYAIRSNGSNEG